MEMTFKEFKEKINKLQIDDKDKVEITSEYTIFICKNKNSDCYNESAYLNDIIE